MKPSRIAALAAVIILGAIYTFSGKSALGYETSWKGALQRARSEKKPIFLSFGGSW